MSDRTVPALQLNAQNTKDCRTSEEGQEQAAPLLARPEEILGNPTLSKEEKRAVLASWLSDARALPDAPRWRQLDNGALVDVDDLYTALRVLDDFDVGIERGASVSASSTSWRPRRKSRWIGNFIRRKRDALKIGIACCEKPHDLRLFEAVATHGLGDDPIHSRIDGTREDRGHPRRHQAAGRPIIIAREALGVAHTEHPARNLGRQPDLG